MTVHVAGHRVIVDPRSAWQAARAEVASEPMPLRWWIVALLGLVAVGAIAALPTIPPGTEVFGTSPVFEWGLLIAAYVFLVVTTSGLCLVSSLGQVFGIEQFRPVVRRAVAMAILFLLAGFLVIALDLHYPVRLVFGVVMSPSPTSPMWWMGTVYAVYLVFLLLEFAGLLLHEERIARPAGLAALVCAIVAPSTLGAVFGVIAARPFWHGPFVPVYFLMSALLSGAAALGIVYGLVNRFGLRGAASDVDRVVPALRALLALMIAVTIVFTAWQSFIGLYGGVPSLSEATKAELVGPLAPRFWIFRVLVGLAVPLAILVHPRMRDPEGLLAASSFAFVGMLADRILFVSAAQVAPPTAASGIVGLPYVDYSPSLVELGIVIGALAFVALGYTLAERFLDLREDGDREPEPAGARASSRPGRPVDGTRGEHGRVVLPEGVR